MGAQVLVGIRAAPLVDSYTDSCTAANQCYHAKAESLTRIEFGQRERLVAVVGDLMLRRAGNAVQTQ